MWYENYSLPNPPVFGDSVPLRAPDNKWSRIVTYCCHNMFYLMPL